MSQTDPPTAPRRRVHIGGDHAAYELQRALVTHLRQTGHDVVDHGPQQYDEQDDYPLYVLATAAAVAADPGSLGVVLGGSGNGEQIAANKVPGIRAAWADRPELAVLAREHNDAQILSLGGRFVTIEQGIAVVEAFLATDFSNAERHRRRLDMVARYETSGSAPEVV